MTAQIMKTRLFIVAITGLLLLGPAPAWSEETVVRMLHIEDDQEKVALWQQIARDYEAQHPNVRVQLNHMDNQSFKLWLPTLLKSSEPPHIIHSWGGGVFQELVEAGELKDISAQMRGDWEQTLDPKGLAAFTTPQGAVYGAPLKFDLEVVWYNKALFEKAGIKAADIKSYGDFLEAVKKLKAAGITPIAVGGREQWPLHFYWTMLALRLGGKEAFEAAYHRTGEGFSSQVFVRAAELFRQLVELKPFQPDFLRANYRDAAAYFGDGKAAMHFMGPFDYINQRLFSSNGKGIPDDELDYFQFPMVEGGKGQPDDTLGAVNGWLVTKDAPAEAVDFLRFFLNEDHQAEMARRNMHIPMTKGTAEALQNPLMKRIAEDFARSSYFQLVYDQMLGRGGGIMVNELSAALAAGSITPEEAAQDLQEEWQLE
jgi:raffinose/stachyose/melibiose transport system substrate-binding protein